MTHSQQFFSADYFIARNRFRELTTKAHGQLHSIALDACGPQNENLSIDIAWFGTNRARRVLLHSSGIHGVEGFAGSAIQLQLLQDLPALPEDAALIVVHSLNPYGMTYLRRVNENNVDLNRNFLDKKDDPETVLDLQQAQTGYGAVDSFLNPPNPPCRDFYKLRAGLLICKYGMPPLKQAVVGGQYWFPKGLFYGGKFLVQPGRIRSELQQGAKEYQAFLVERLSSTESVLAIDIHTGLGKFATDTLLVEEKEEDARAIFGDRVTPLNPEKGVAYHAWGSLGSMLSRTLPKANVLFVTQEFGTYSAMNVLHALREENRWHHYGSGELNHPTKQKLKATFCPDDETWRESVLNRGKELLRQGLARMCEDAPIMCGGQPK